MFMDNKEKNILMVHNYYQFAGGEDTVVANEKRMLEEHGHKVILYTRNNSELKTFSIIKKLLFPFSVLFNGKTYKDVRKIIKENHIDIVHVHNTLSLVSPSVYYAAGSCKVPVVQTVHNFRFLCPGATLYRNGHICEDCIHHGLWCAVLHGCYRKSRIQTLICVINTMVHRMTGVYKKINYICLTEFNREKLLQINKLRKKQLISPDRVFIKTNFVNDEYNGISTGENKDGFIFAGRLEKLKGIEYLLYAWKKMGSQAPRLFICGTGPMEKWCREYIRKNDLPSVIMKGFVPNGQLRKFIADSEALIMPTQCYEGLPMIIIEAYSVGAPVIGSDIGNVAGMIEVKAVWNIRNGSLSRNGIRKLYENKYLPDINYDILMDIYDQISL